MGTTCYGGFQHEVLLFSFSSIFLAVASSICITFCSVCTDAYAREGCHKSSLYFTYRDLSVTRTMFLFCEFIFYVHAAVKTVSLTFLQILVYWMSTQETNLARSLKIFRNIVGFFFRRGRGVSLYEKHN